MVKFINQHKKWKTIKFKHFAHPKEGFRVASVEELFHLLFGFLGR